MAMIAIEVPQNISDILQNIDIKEKIIKSDRANHITLLYLNDDLKMETILKILPIIYEVTRKEKPFIVEAKNYSSFPKGKHGYPIITKIKNSNLNNLRDKIKKSFDENNIEYNNKFPKFIAHVTLGYYFNEVEGNFNLISWPINKICLYCGDKNKEKIYIEFELGKLEKYSSYYLNDLAEYFEDQVIN